MWQEISTPLLSGCAKPDLHFQDILWSVIFFFSLYLLGLFHPLSISSTLMEMESTVSSGRSTPAMVNGQSSARACGAKTVAYACCWDLCPQCFNSSPDLAEHIRGIHVDGQRGGVSKILNILL